MPEIILYIATSIDGFIAKSDGSVDWLSVVEDKNSDYGYADFYKSIDALIMGSATYEQVLTFGKWPYEDKPAFIFTRRHIKTANKNVIFNDQQPRHFLRETGKNYENIWLVGGGKLITSFFKEQLIDTFIFSVAPVILGSGIPLVSPAAIDQTLQLIDRQRYDSGLVQIKYRK